MPIRLKSVLKMVGKSSFRTLLDNVVGVVVPVVYMVACRDSISSWNEPHEKMQCTEGTTTIY